MSSKKGLKDSLKISPAGTLQNKQNFHYLMKIDIELFYDADGSKTQVYAEKTANKYKLR